MSLSNPNLPVTEERLQEFYHKLLPYLGGGAGGGHTIEDSEGTDLTQRDTLQFGEGFIAEDDDTNEKTVISPNVMQSGDINDVVTPLPSVQTRYHKYSTEEQIVGEWIDGKPLYQKTIVTTMPTVETSETYTNKFVSVGTSIEFGMITCCATMINDDQSSVTTYYSNNGFSAQVKVLLHNNSHPTNPNTVELITNDQGYAEENVYITIQYTKYIREE